MQTNKCYVISGKETTVALSQMIWLYFNLGGEWQNKVIGERLDTGELSVSKS